MRNKVQRRRPAKLKLTCLIAAILALSSCAGFPKALPEAERQSLDEAADTIAAGMKRSPGPYAAEDALAATRATEAFFEYLGRRHPGSTERIAAMRAASELAPYLASAFGETPYEDALAAFMEWDRAPAARAWDEAKADRLETEHFIVLSMPGTVGYEDREYVARLCERLLDALQSRIALALPEESAAMRARFAENMASLRANKVLIMLPPNSRAFKGFGDTASTNWGFTLDGGALGIEASIKLPYFNALSSAILAHELTHLVEIFFKLDLDAAPPIPAMKDGRPTKAYVESLQAWAGPVFKAIVPWDTGFGEGFAERMAAEVSPMHQAFFDDPDELLRVARSRVPLSKDILAASPTVKDRRVRIVRYAELHSFVSYLIEARGLDAFLSFYMDVPVRESRFVEVYGSSYRAMQDKWMAARGY
jgi:hypothetical protein